MGAYLWNGSRTNNDHGRISDLELCGLSTLSLPSTHNSELFISLFLSASFVCLLYVLYLYYVSTYPLLLNHHPWRSFSLLPFITLMRLGLG